jgi:KDO2-lipid IV(A) lauroyltransferase
MPDSARPPFRWIFNGTDAQRGAAFRYWIRDSIVGPINVVLHYSMMIVPIDVASAVGAFCGQLAKYRYPQSDARAREVWKRLRPAEADQASTDAAINRLWRNVGRTMVEFSVLHRLWGAGRIELVGQEHIVAARATGRPLAFIGIHLGNWETLGPSLVATGNPFGAIYMLPDNRFDHFIATRARNRYGAELIRPERNAGRQAIRHLNEKRTLLMYVDELARGRVWAPAFGRPLRTGGNLSYTLRIARKTNALVLPIYCLRQSEQARFKVTVLPPLQLRETADEDADLMANLATIDAVLDPIIRANLDQWFFGLDFEFEDDQKR